MAKITFGPIVAEARNKQGGIVYSRGRSGPYTRLKVSGVNPRTARQTAVRTNLSAGATAWRDLLNNDDRLQWNTAAGTITLTDKLGHTYQPTGQQLYCASWANLASISGGPPIPPSPATRAPDIVGPVYAILQLSSTFTIVYTTTALTTLGLAIYSSPPYPPSRTYLWRHMRKTHTENPGSVPTTDFMTDYLTTWSTPLPNQVIGLRLTLFDTSSGIPSGSALVRGTVVP